ncbi:MAG: 23S rRNA (uracil(1939)-C(5))-methyltransferase RlmD [Desulfovibrio sp.]|nr:23S rRNA (uracil(1939)-C(5))-methyltransferase RlmD [Desulfovibrio sp.]
MKNEHLHGLTITALSHDGRGIARLAEHSTHTGSLTVFVQGALPGQKVDVRTVRVSPRFIEAEVDKICAEKGLIRPLCPHWEHCGGCPLQRMPYSEQLFWKRDIVKNAMARIGGLPQSLLENLVAPVLPSPETEGFRNKMEFAFGETEGTLVLGLRSAASHKVLQTSDCILINKEARKILTALEEEVRKYGGRAYTFTTMGRRKKEARGFWRFAVLRTGFDIRESRPGYWLLLLTSHGNQRERAIVRRVASELLGRFEALRATVHEERQSPDGLSTGEKRIFVLGKNGEDDELLSLPLAGKQFHLDVASFFQVNSSAADNLAKLVQNAMGQRTPDTLLDLFSGVGAPGLLLAKNFSKIHALEANPRSVALAARNAARFHAGNYIPYARTVEKKHLASLPLSTPFALLLDPPRSGLAKESLEWIINKVPHRIVYVSCNPATLARDTGMLLKAYHPVSCAPVDLFPHTPHVETVLAFHKR